MGPATCSANERHAKHPAGYAKHPAGYTKHPAGYAKHPAGHASPPTGQSSVAFLTGKECTYNRPFSRRPVPFALDCCWTQQ
jgi:hypothetical protein